MFGDYDWFLSAIRLGRLSSIAYTTLFSTQATWRAKEYCLESIKSVRRALEEWRLSVPVAFRPREVLQLNQSASASRKLVAIRTQYSYYNLVIALERLSLHVESDENIDREGSKWNLMHAARAVIELTPFIDIEPYVPIL